MKKGTTILTIILFITIVMGGCKQSEAYNELITVDLTTSHPEKELILQDFMNVEYIALETNDEFITQGGLLAIGDKFIVVCNRSNDGEIFFFDRKTGKGVKKINRKGQGSEEYTYINKAVLDENKNELFVNCAGTKKIFVYDLSGNFKRSFKHTEGAEYMEIVNYDEDNLIRYDVSEYYNDGSDRGKQSYHAIISKQDGSITKDISIPFDIVKPPKVQNQDGVAVASVSTISPYFDNFLLADTSSDTIYNYISKENKLVPFLVQKPSVDPEIILNMGTITDRYYFIKTIKKTFDFTTGRGFPNSDLMYDKQENAVFNISVLNDDYLKKQKVDLTSKPINGKIATAQSLAAHRLVEAFENNELKGKLKEIAAELNEESNPVVMVMSVKTENN